MKKGMFHKIICPLYILVETKGYSIRAACVPLFHKPAQSK